MYGISLLLTVGYITRIFPLTEEFDVKIIKFKHAVEALDEKNKLDKYLGEHPDLLKREGDKFFFSDGIRQYIIVNI